MAEAALLLTSATVQVSGMASSSERHAPMTQRSTVPVSPSGTGKTFNSSTRVRWLEILLAPEIIASRRILPVIMVLHLNHLTLFWWTEPHQSAAMSSTYTSTWETFSPVACSTSSRTRWVMLWVMEAMFSP